MHRIPEECIGLTEKYLQLISGDTITQLTPESKFYHYLELLFCIVIARWQLAEKHAWVAITNKVCKTDSLLIVCGQKQSARSSDFWPNANYFMFYSRFTTFHLRFTSVVNDAHFASRLAHNKLDPPK